MLCGVHLGACFQDRYLEGFPKRNLFLVCSSVRPLFLQRRTDRRVRSLIHQAADLNQSWRGLLSSMLLEISLKWLLSGYSRS